MNFSLKTKPSLIALLFTLVAGFAITLGFQNCSKGFNLNEVSQVADLASSSTNSLLSGAAAPTSVGDPNICGGGPFCRHYVNGDTSQVVYLCPTATNPVVESQVGSAAQTASFSWNNASGVFAAYPEISCVENVTFKYNAVVSFKSICTLVNGSAIKTTDFFIDANRGDPQYAFFTQSDLDNNHAAVSLSNTTPRCFGEKLFNANDVSTKYVNLGSLNTAVACNYTENLAVYGINVPTSIVSDADAKALMSRQVPDFCKARVEYLSLTNASTVQTLIAGQSNAISLKSCSVYETGTDFNRMACNCSVTTPSTTAGGLCSKNSLYKVSFIGTIPNLAPTSTPTPTSPPPSPAPAPSPNPSTQTMDCSLAGHPIPNTQSLKYAENAVVPYGSVCKYEDRKCTDGILSGTYTAEICHVATGAQTAVANRNVTALYQRVLERTAAEMAADRQGLIYWMSKVLSGMSLATVEQYMRASNEYYVRNLYRTELLRSGDIPGIQYWTAELESGRRTRESVQAEFKSICQNHTNGECGACVLNGTPVPNTQSVTAYSAQAVPAGTTCEAVAQQRTCTNGMLSGTFPYSSCQVSSLDTAVIRDQIIALYKRVLERTDAEIAADEAGVQFWINANVNGESLTLIEIEMKNSDEYFIRQLYRTELGRAGDVPGIYYWRDEITSGRKTRAAVQVEFKYICTNKINGECASCTLGTTTVETTKPLTAYKALEVPFGSVCESEQRMCTNGVLSGTYAYDTCKVKPATVSVRDQVIELYKRVLERTDAEMAADEAGITFWVNAVNSGTSLQSVEDSMRASDEFYVRNLYKTELYRAGDPDGIKYWTAEITAGRVSRAALKTQFQNICSQHINGECAGR
jgi:hypothetical protein